MTHLGNNLSQLYRNLREVNSSNSSFNARLSPFDNSGFRVSAGVAYNGNKITATAKIYLIALGASTLKPVYVLG